MIQLTGDTHGELECIYQYKYSLTEKDYLVILGDFGFVWGNNTKSNLETLSKFKFTILFVDGNHEDFNQLNDFPVVEKFGAKVSQLAKNVFWLRRGEIYIIENKTFLTVGGAFSIDKANRRENISWWKEEEINFDESSYVLKQIESVKKVDYVLTHTCPTSIIEKLFGINGYKIDANSKLFQHIIDNNLLEFNHWYFGHFHENVDYQNFTCLYNHTILLN